MIAKKNGPSRRKPSSVLADRVQPSRQPARRQQRPVAEVVNRDTTSDESSISSGLSSDESDREESTAGHLQGIIPPVPRTSHVSQRTMQKIKQGEYFSIKKLLPCLDDDDERDEQMTYQEWRKYEERPRQREKSDKQLNFFEWTRCFHTFMSLRLQTAPTELQGMLRHAEVVQDLASQGKNAIDYDAKFRRVKEQHPHIKWGQYLPDVVDGLQPLRFARPTYNRGANFVSYQPRTANFASYRPRQQIGICRNFNSRAGCSFANCKFSHKCQSCLRPSHSVTTCYANSRSQHAHMPNYSRR